MAITKSAKKSHKRSLVLRQRNLDFKIAMKKAIRDLKKGVEEKKEWSALMSLLSAAFSKIDKARSRNIIHRKNADRKKHRLNKMVKAMA
jgi:small subunit ribosomal protein S20